MLKLGKHSKEKYETLHVDLRRIIDRALIYSRVDFGLSYGYRSPEEQFELFKKGRKEIKGKWTIVNKSKVVTYLDGYEKLSKHNEDPSVAFDFYAWVPGKKELMYNKSHLIFLASMFLTIGADLYNRGETEYKVRWGGNFKQLPELILNKGFVDMPHIELIGC